MSSYRVPLPRLWGALLLLLVFFSESSSYAISLSGLTNVVSRSAHEYVQDRSSTVPRATHLLYRWRTNLLTGTITNYWDTFFVVTSGDGSRPVSPTTRIRLPVRGGRSSVLACPCRDSSEESGSPVTTATLERGVAVHCLLPLLTDMRAAATNQFPQLGGKSLPLLEIVFRIDRPSEWSSGAEYLGARFLVSNPEQAGEDDERRVIHYDAVSITVPMTPELLGSISLTANTESVTDDGVHTFAAEPQRTEKLRDVDMLRESIRAIRDMVDW